MTVHGVVVQSSLFTHKTLKDIPAVTVSPETLACHDELATLHACLKDFDTHFLQTFSMRWANRFAIDFIDVIDPYFSMRCHHKALPNPSMIAHYAPVKEVMHHLKTTASKKSKKEWVADMRFDNQIVISGDMVRESHNG